MVAARVVGGGAEGWVSMKAPRLLMMLQLLPMISHGQLDIDVEKVLPIQ